MSQGLPRPIAARQLILSTLPWMRTLASKRASSSSVHIPESVIGVSGVRIYSQICAEGGILSRCSIPRYMVRSPGTGYYHRHPEEGFRNDPDLQLDSLPESHTMEATIMSGTYRTTKKSICFNCIFLSILHCPCRTLVTLQRCFIRQPTINMSLQRQVRIQYKLKT